MTEETIAFRRAELYDEVWAEPLGTVAERYGVSEPRLRRICRKLRVPLPGRGHWARVRAGQDATRPVLDPVPHGAVTETVVEYRPYRDPKPARLASVPSEPAIVVLADLRNPHPLVFEASRLLRGRDPNDGLVRCRRTSCLDITVSPAALGRALRIMHALIRELEKRGLRVEVTPPRSYEEDRDRDESEAPGNATRVLISGEWVQFGLTEKRSAVHPPAPEVPRNLRGPERESWIRFHQPRAEFVPNGVLELVIKGGDHLLGRKLWHDAKRRRVEECLNEFIAHLRLTAEAIKQYHAETERRRREYSEAEQRRLEDQRRQTEEAGHEENFRRELARWRLARDVREYIAEIQALQAVAHDSVADASPLCESLKWAMAYADRIDPLTPLRGEFVGPKG